MTPEARGTEALNATRLVVNAQDTTGDALQPTIIPTVNGAKGYGVARPFTPQFSGEDYWKAQGAWLDDAQFQFNQYETKYFLEHYADQLADILIKSPQPEYWQGPYTRDAVAEDLRNSVDCNDANGGLDDLWDDATYANRPGLTPGFTTYRKGAVGHLPSTPLRWDLNATTAPQVFNVIKDAAVTMTTRNPQFYGGSTTMGPNPQHPSSWNTGD